MRIFWLCCFLILKSVFLFGQSALFISPEAYHLKKYKTVEQSFPVEKGFVRVKVDQNSFAAYLRNLPVLTNNVDVLDFNNRTWKESTDSVLAGVVPINIAGKRLWQCMDILIRLHVDFLEKNAVYNISYPLADGTLLSWQEWQNGIRPVFIGMHFTKKLLSKQDDSYKNFNRYLNSIFEYTGTQTFWHYYPDVKLKDIKAADFIVKKGRKGHAILIVDMAKNSKGEKIVLIGQGDTPACQFYLLKQKNGNPWFPIDPKSSQPDLPIKKKMSWSGLRRFP